LSFSLNADLTCLLCCLALSAKEVAVAVKLMFDKPLTDRGNGVPGSFNSDNLPPEVMYYLSFDCNVFDDNAFPLDEPKGHFLKLSQM
jgi:hypothetical protein